MARASRIRECERGAHRAIAINNRNVDLIPVAVTRAWLLKIWTSARVRIISAGLDRAACVETRRRVIDASPGEGTDVEGVDFVSGIVRMPTTPNEHLISRAVVARAAFNQKTH